MYSPRRYFYLPLIALILVGWFSISYAAAPTQNENYQDFTDWYLAKHNVAEVPWRAAAVIESGSFAPLYYYQEQTQMPAASLIKLVTAGTVLRYPIDWWQKIGFSWADNEGDFRQYLDPGDGFSKLKLNPLDKVSLEQAFGSMLVGSANNAANRMSTVTVDSREQFIQRMRQTAIDWDMINTTIEEPTGLSLNNLSTAQDIALGACHAFANFIIQYYTSKPQISFTTVNGEAKVIKHTVHRLRSDPKRWFGAKTGFLRETNYHIAAGFITPQGKKICVAVLSTADRVTSESIVYDLGEWVDEMYSW